MRDLVGQILLKQVECRNGDRSSLSGIHGIGHWCRVAENAIRICDSEGIDSGIGLLFGLVHDCCRMNDGYDVQHGPRAAEWLRSISGQVDWLSYGDILSVALACEEHTVQRTSLSVAVQACMDADRLDLGRLGIQPRKDLLQTVFAKQVLFSSAVDAGYLKSRSCVMDFLCIDDEGFDYGGCLSPSQIIQGVLSC